MLLDMELSNKIPIAGCQRLCDPCDCVGKQTVASNFCSECEENMCDECTNNHAKQKVTKFHQSTSIAPTEVSMCEPCDNDGTKIKADGYCDLCEEYLCHDCVAVHKRMKATKTHEPRPVSVNEIDSKCDNTDEKKELIATGNDKGTDTMAPLEKQTILQFDPADSQHTPELSNSAALENMEIANEETMSSDLETSCDMINNDKNDPKTYTETYDEEHDQSSSRIETKYDLDDGCLGTVPLENTNQEVSSVTVEMTAENPVQLKNESMENSPTVDTSKMSVYQQPGILTEDDARVELYTVEMQDPQHVSNCSKQSPVAVNQLPEHVDNGNMHTPNNASEENEDGKAITDHADTLAEETEFQTNMVIPNISKELEENVIEENDANESEENAPHKKSQCPLCEYLKQNKIISNQCGVCSNMFCDDCFETHIESVCMTEDPPKESSIEEICQPCFSVSNRKLVAEMWCKDCEEYMCHECYRRHSSTKALRNHAIIKAKEKKTEKEKYCNPCTIMEKRNIARAMCLDCEEYLCSECTNYHKAQKVTRAHKIVDGLDGGATAGADDETNLDQASDIERMPGQPRAIDIGPDSVTLTWDKPKHFRKDGRFQVEYKLQDIEHSGWQTFDLEPLKESTVVLDCKPNTVYRFRVKCILKSGESPHSLESEDITTPTSLGAELVDFSRCIVKGQPSPNRYELPVTEWLNARNPAARTRKFEVGRPTMYKEEKTILLIGATGTGKSTLVDGLVNYVLGVDWTDPFRFVAVRLEEEEQKKHHNQAMSQTEWITTYSINPTDRTRIRYRLNIIDTPGFGDCRGLERDQQIVDQIRGLFSATGPQGIAMLDAICFLIKAPDARLTPIQSYIFQSIMSLFGNDVEKNICSLITFADGDEPPVLAALKQSQLPFGQYFTFNNSALFAKNVSSRTSLSKMFWQMGLQSFDDFFKQLENFQPKSLNLTKNVLDERFRLEMTVKNLQPKVDVGLSKIDHLKQEIAIVEQHKSYIKDNENFEYEVTEVKQNKTDLPAGMHVTNCIKCNFTCHFPCGIPNDANKKGCWAMESDGYCRICPDNCFWDNHFNTPYKFEYISVQVKKTFDDMRAKYKDAKGKLPTQEQLVAKMVEELDELVETIEDMMEMVKHCNERLAEIALRPNPLTLTDHIDLMIENEKMERRRGFQRRIKSLNEFRKRAEVSKQANMLCKEAVSTFSAVGKTRVKRQKDIRSLFKVFQGLFGF